MTVGCVVDQSVPAAHDRGVSLAHFVSASFVYVCVLVVWVGSISNVELEPSCVSFVRQCLLISLFTDESHFFVLQSRTMNLTA